MGSRTSVKIPLVYSSWSQNDRATHLSSSKRWLSCPKHERNSPPFWKKQLCRLGTYAYSRIRLVHFQLDPLLWRKHQPNCKSSWSKSQNYTTMQNKKRRICLNHKSCYCNLSFLIDKFHLKGGIRTSLEAIHPPGRLRRAGQDALDDHRIWHHHHRARTNDLNDNFSENWSRGHKIYKNEMNMVCLWLYSCLNCALFGKNQEAPSIVRTGEKLYIVCYS